MPYVAPPGLLVKRSRWVGPTLLVSFVGAALAIHLSLRQLTYDYGQLVGKLADVHRFELPKQASIAVRPFTIALLVAFAACAAGSVRARVRLTLVALSIYLPIMIVTDVVLARVARHGGLSPFSTRGNIIDGLIGILAVCLAVFCAARLPADLYLEPVLKRPKRYLVILVLSLAATAASIIALFHVENGWLHKLAAIPLFGGLLSIVVLSISLFPVFLCAFGYLSELVRRQPHSVARAAGEVSGNGRAASNGRSAGNGRGGGNELSGGNGQIGGNGKVSGNGKAGTPAEIRESAAFGFLVPAHNEEGRIGDCIRAIDNCAAESAARATLYVVENGSTDRTYEEAREALERCRYIRGVLLTSSTELKSRAKAHALNTGLAAATEPVIVRVDADTFVSRGMLNRMAPYFSDPQVGGVGAVPLPHKVTIWIERMRTLEVYYGAGFKRTAQGAVDAIPVLPGATVAFRRELLVKVGGFSEGILGEDSDITVRIGRLGYRIVSDPAIKVYSEQPQNFRDLREQRMRWSTGLFHMIGHNRSAIFHRHQGLRGTWTLPWACFVMFRKLMLIPFAVAALALILVGQSLFPLKEIAAAGAITLGAQLIGMAIVVTLLAGPRDIISLPSYIVFRLIVTYFALEVLFTVALKEPRSILPVPLPRRSGRRRAA